MAAQVREWLGRAFTWLQADAPDWAELEVLNREWSRFNVKPELYDSICYNASQARVNLTQLRKRTAAKERESAIAARIKADRANGKATWRCKCVPAEDDWDPLPCMGCLTFERAGVDVKVDKDGFRTVVMSEAQAKEAKRDDDEDKAAMALDSKEEEEAADEIKPFAFVDRWSSPTIPKHYLTALDGEIYLKRLLAHQYMPPVLVNGVRWLADVRHRVFSEGDQMFRWQCAAEAIKDPRTHVVTDNDSNVVFSSIRGVGRLETFGRQDRHDYQDDRSDANTRGPPAAQRVILGGELECMNAYELHQLVFDSVSPSQIYAVGHNFREHYELMKHEHAHAWELLGFLASVLCACESGPNVRHFMSRVLCDSIPPLDPRSGASSNPYVLLFVSERSSLSSRR